MCIYLKNTVISNKLTACLFIRITVCSILGPIISPVRGFGQRYNSRHEIDFYRITNTITKGFVTSKHSGSYIYRSVERFCQLLYS